MNYREVFDNVSSRILNPFDHLLMDITSTMRLFVESFHVRIVRNKKSFITILQLQIRHEYQ